MCSYVFLSFYFICAILRLTGQKLQRENYICRDHKFCKPVIYFCITAVDCLTSLAYKKSFIFAKKVVRLHPIESEKT